jgi:hypothetical protein
VLTPGSDSHLVIYRYAMKKFGLLAVVLLQMSIVGLARDDAPSSGWKEYVYSEDEFAITLPGDPHPHKSSQMPNGTVYLLQLSSGAIFSLHTMEANDKCVDAVRSQSDIYAKNKADSATSTSKGFKAISFREVTGSGYTGVEFIQQVPPAGRLDYERWVCGPHRLYVLAFAWSPDESEPRELRRIVDSFRLVTKK